VCLSVRWSVRDVVLSVCLCLCLVVGYSSCCRGPCLCFIFLFTSVSLYFGGVFGLVVCHGAISSGVCIVLLGFCVCESLRLCVWLARVFSFRVSESVRLCPSGSASESVSVAVYICPCVCICQSVRLPVFSVPILSVCQSVILPF
jgi:hypothetical protein